MRKERRSGSERGVSPCWILRPIQPSPIRGTKGPSFPSCLFGRVDIAILLEDWKFDLGMVKKIDFVI